MAITVAMRTQVAQLYTALFGRAPESDGLGYWVGQMDAGKSFAQVADAMYATTPARVYYPSFLTNDEIVGRFYTNVLGRTATADDITYWSGKLGAKGATPGGVIGDMIYSVTAYAGTDAAALASQSLFNNKVTVGLYYAVDLGGNDVVKAGTILQGVTSAASSVDAAKTAATGAAGQTYTLTTGVDLLTGSAGNDTFIADNSANTMASAGDQLNGGNGTDTFKLYVAAATAVDAIALPQLTSVENVYIKNGTLTNAATLDVSTVAGVNSIELDGQKMMAGADAFTVKTTATQSVVLDNETVANAGAATITLAAANTLTLNNVGVGATGVSDGALTVDIKSGTATSASIATTGAASKVTLTNTGAKVASLTVTGDQNLTLTESLGTLKTINASAATGKITVDTTGVTVDAAFAFTGGSGNDTLKLTQTSLDALTAGSQLAGGAGTDTLVVTSAGALTFAAADYKAVNAATGFEILGLGVAGGQTGTLDASLLTSIKEFAVSAGTNVISKIASGTTVDINGATTKTTVTGAVGTSDLAINIGSATATTGTANTALDVTGLTNVTVNANIKAGTAAAGHNLGTLTNSDNSVFTIKGNGDLTVALAAATLTGSKIDGSASTGILTLTGNSAALDGTKASLGDILIGGAGADIIKSGANSSVLTGGAGKDTFDVTAAVSGASTPVTTVTDFAKGDMLKLANATALLKIDLSGQAAGKTDAQIFTALAAADVATGNVAWGVYNGNTYVFDEVATAGAINATDIAVKLTGVLDLSTSTVAANVVTFA